MSQPPPFAAPLLPQFRQRDAALEAAVNLRQSGGMPVSRDLLPTAPLSVAAFGELRMTRGERMGALDCMLRATVMHELAQGDGKPGAL